MITVRQLLEEAKHTNPQHATVIDGGSRSIFNNFDKEVLAWCRADTRVCFIYATDRGMFAYVTNDNFFYEEHNGLSFRQLQINQAEEFIRRKIEDGCEGEVYEQISLFAQRLLGEVVAKVHFGHLRTVDCYPYYGNRRMDDVSESEMAKLRKHMEGNLEGMRGSIFLIRRKKREVVVKRIANHEPFMREEGTLIPEPNKNRIDDFKDFADLYENSVNKDGLSDWIEEELSKEPKNRRGYIHVRSCDVDDYILNFIKGKVMLSDI